MFSEVSSHAGELRAEGAVEAAQDSNSKVTSEDAQRVMLSESEKAGVTAYKFDPNATPEEKAAQARSVRFTHICTNSSYKLLTLASVRLYLLIFTMRENRKPWV